MKIIKKGRPQKGWAKQFECTGRGNGDGGCGAILLVEQADLYYVTRSCYDEAERVVSFQCCLCDVETDLLPTSLTGINFTILHKNEWKKKEEVSAKEVPQFIGSEIGSRPSEPDMDCG